MDKELHIWMGENYSGEVSLDDLYLTIEATEYALNKGVEDRIDTVQPHFCNTTYLVKGYRIFVHMLDDEVVEMKLEYINNCAKEIRVAHNLEKMLLCNCFGKATTIN